MRAKALLNGGKRLFTTTAYRIRLWTRLRWWCVKWKRKHIAQYTAVIYFRVGGDGRRTESRSWQTVFSPPIALAFISFLTLGRWDILRARVALFINYVFFRRRAGYYANSPATKCRRLPIHSSCRSSATVVFRWSGIGVGVASGSVISNNAYDNLSPDIGNNRSKYRSLSSLSFRRYRISLTNTRTIFTANREEGMRWIEIRCRSNWTSVSYRALQSSHTYCNPLWPWRLWWAWRSYILVRLSSQLPHPHRIRLW